MARLLTTRSSWSRVAAICGAGAASTVFAAALAIGNLSPAFADDEPPEAPPSPQPPIDPDAPAPLVSDVPDCVIVRTESRLNGVAFSHVVIVTNQCTLTVQCQIATDADPSPVYSVRIPPNQTDEVVTRLVSPDAQVSANATCRLEGVGTRAYR